MIIFKFNLQSKLSSLHSVHFRKDRVFRKRDNRDHPSLLSPNVAMQEGCPTPERARTFGISQLSENGIWAYKVSGTTSTRGNFGVSVGAGMHW
jgi:hypothetical protein